MDRIINIVALAISIAALVPLFSASAPANASWRRLLLTFVITVLALLIGNHLYTKYYEDKEAQRVTAEHREQIDIIKRDIIQKLKESPMTWDQMSGETNEYNFDDKNEAIDQLKNENLIDSKRVRLKKDSQGSYEAKVWYLRAGGQLP